MTGPGTATIAEPTDERTERLQAHAAFLRTRPSDDQIAVVAAALGLGPVRRIVRLTGGLVSSVHRLEFDTTAVVIRRSNPDEPWYDEARIEREVRILDALVDTPVPAPRPLWADVDGSRSGIPSVVLSALPGRGVDPPDDPLWSRRLAEAAATVHAQPPMIEAEAWLHAWRDEDAPVPSDARAASVWEAVDRVRHRLARAPTTLAHHDLHPGNTLWLDGRLTGIVDWGLAGAGYADLDIAYCGMDLWLCSGPAAGERFLRAHEDVTGRPLDPGWRVVATTRALDDVGAWVRGYVDLGIDVTVAEVRERFARWVEDALRRVD